MKYLLLLSSLIAGFSFVTGAFAARPCKVIAEACLSAGVIHRGDSEDTIIGNCIRPVLAGKNVGGVKMDATTINACKAKMASR